MNSFPLRLETLRVDLSRAHDVERAMSAVRRYLAAWPAADVALLPADLASTALPGREAVYARAFLASRAELDMATKDDRHAALREMAIAMGAAAARLRELHSYESISEVSTANLMTPAPSRAGLQAEVRLRP